MLRVKRSTYDSPMTNLSVFQEDPTFRSKRFQKKACSTSLKPWAAKWLTPHQRNSWFKTYDHQEHPQKWTLSHQPRMCSMVCGGTHAPWKVLMSWDLVSSPKTLDFTPLSQSTSDLHFPWISPCPVDRDSWISPHPFHGDSWMEYGLTVSTFLEYE